MLQKSNFVFIFVNISLVRWEIWLWIYCKNVIDVHLPCFWMMVSKTPYILSAIAPPAQREWTPTRSASMPFLCRLSCCMLVWTPCLICAGVIVCQMLSLSMKSERRFDSLPLLDRVGCICLAKALTGPWSSSFAVL